MNAKRVSGALLLLCVACEGEVITFQEGRENLTSAATGGGGATSGTGGSGAVPDGGLAGYAGNIGAECSGLPSRAAPDLSFGGYQSAGGYQPGCYGGGSGVEGPDGNMRFGNTIRGCELERVDPTAVFSSFEYECCRAGSIAAPFCDEAVDCPRLVGAPEPSCIDFRSTRACVLRCESDAECPSDMICGHDYVHGSMCMFADTVWFPGCTENYCLDSSKTPFYLTGQDVRCGESVPCCAGLVCSPDGECI
jgi:hypothetical protein